MTNTDAFELTTRIGHGALGEVWKGRHTATGQPVAIKIFTGRTLWNASSWTRFEAEAVRLAGLNHPGLVAALDWGCVPLSWLERFERPEQVVGRPFLVSELVDGVFIADHCDDLQWDAVVPLVAELLDALGHLHARGILHLNLKPNNLFVEHHRLRLTDAIFVCDLGPGPRVGAIGPSRYCAPEQLYGRWRDCGPWTDLYGVGGLIRRLITGHDPEGHRSEQAQPPVYSPKFAVPEGLSAWIQSLLAERVDDRPHSTAEAMASLRELEPNVPLLNPPPRVSHLITAPWSEGKRWVWPQVNRTVEHDVALAWVDRQLSRATQPAALVISGDEAQGRSTLLGDLRARIHHQTGI
ncbi:MAG: serine/threonine-protein kinase, partial [Myxococcota bacterium]